MTRTKNAGNKPLSLTMRGQHAVMAMVELAHAGYDRPVPLSLIAGKSHISLSYLEQIFAALRRGGLVRSHRGPGGGYQLARPANDIVVSDIIASAVDASADRKNADTNRQTRALWDHMGMFRHAYLTHVTLEDVVHERLPTHPITNKLFETLGGAALS